MHQLSEFKQGTQFFWVDEKGKKLIDKADTVDSVDEITGMVHGYFMSVHYTACRIKLQQPEQLKKLPKYFTQTLPFPLTKN